MNLLVIILLIVLYFVLPQYSNIIGILLLIAIILYFVPLFENFGSRSRSTYSGPRGGGAYSGPRASGVRGPQGNTAYNGPRTSGSSINRNLSGQTEWHQPYNYNHHPYHYSYNNNYDVNRYVNYTSPSTVYTSPSVSVNYASYPLIYPVGIPTSIYSATTPISCSKLNELLTEAVSMGKISEDQKDNIMSQNC